MKKFTQQDFDNFKVNENGYKECPTGDYSLIKEFTLKCSFGEYCSFGNWCRFGNSCRFGEQCRFENVGLSKSGYPFIAYTGAGAMDGSKAYFFNLENGIFVRCGCFSGTIDAFEERAKRLNADEDYLVIASLAKKKFNK